MIQWIHVAVLGASLGCVSTLFMVFIWRWCHQRKDHHHRNFVVEPKSFTRMETINQAGIDDHKNNSSKFYVFHGSEKSRTLFSWEDHPYLAADAVENGWSRFNFMAHKSYNIIQSSRSRSTTSTLLGACAVVDDDHGRGIEIEPEITFEVCQDSSEFMQKIRLNPGLKKKNSVSMMIMRASLPLPGPCLGNYAFPQEAYFEVTILSSFSSSSFDDDCKRSSEGEKTKLLVQDDGLNCKKGILDNVDEEMMRVECCKEGRNGKIGSLVMFSLGLSRGGGDVPLRVPGSYHGSIGFNSNGSVFLDGMKLVTESKKEEEEEEWMIGSEKVIGCGFDPRQKKVFFTLNSELVHEIHCQSDEFSTPLYPTLASNIDIIVLINFGQSSFKYEPANAHRTPNPCFMGPIVNSHNAKLGYDDSKELFSMGRIDSQWHNGKSTAKGNIIPNHVAFDFDEESEADLFEIVLDDSGKSPNIVS